jgi:hypothetical protein
MDSTAGYKEFFTKVGVGNSSVIHHVVDDFKVKLIEI